LSASLTATTSCASLAGWCFLIAVCVVDTACSAYSETRQSPLTSVRAHSRTSRPTHTRKSPLAHVKANSNKSELSQTRQKRATQDPTSVQSKMPPLEWFAHRKPIGAEHQALLRSLRTDLACNLLNITKNKIRQHPSTTKSRSSHN
jgi:hypothetical protein